MTGLDRRFEDVRERNEVVLAARAGGLVLGDPVLEKGFAVEAEEDIGPFRVAEGFPEGSDLDFPDEADLLEVDADCRPGAAVPIAERLRFPPFPAIEEHLRAAMRRR